MNFSVRLEGAAEVRGRLRDFGKKAPMAFMRALNRTAQRARTEGQRHVSAGTGLPARQVAGDLRISRATPASLIAMVTPSEFKLPLIRFTGLRGFRSGAGIAGRSFRLGTVPAGAFFAQMRSGRRGIYRRRSGKRLPVEELKGPSVAELIQRFRVWEALEPQLQEIFAERVEHELGRLDEQAG